MNRAYEKPQVIYREKIEARAGACGKVGVGDCASLTFVS